jgi:tetraacyldisaccharide-1-P 4'-kinase
VRGFFDLQGEPRAAPERPFLFSGIARPQRFEQDVRSRVDGLAGSVVFPDHHRFGPADLDRVAERARAAGARALVTTAKDAVRLPAPGAEAGSGDGSWSPRGLDVLVLRIAAEIHDEARFKARLLEVARRAAS